MKPVLTVYTNLSLQVKKKALYSVIFFQISDIKKLHQNTCGNNNFDVQISLDGVNQAKSSSVSLDIYSLSFKNCRTIYPMCIV